MCQAPEKENKQPKEMTQKKPKKKTSQDRTSLCGKDNKVSPADAEHKVNIQNSKSEKSHISNGIKNK